MEFLGKISNGGNERTWAIKEDTWKKYRLEPITLTPEFINDAVDSVFEKEEAKSHERQERFNQTTDLWSKFMELGADYFKRLYNDMEKKRLLSGAEREVVRIASLSIAKMSLTDRQVKKLAQIIEKLDKETDYLIPEK